MESWLEMAIAMMKPIMPIVSMMEVIVVDLMSTHNFVLNVSAMKI